MVLPIGRGALTLGTARPLPTEPLVIPPLCLSGLAAQQNNAAINLDLCTAQNAPGRECVGEIEARKADTSTIKMELSTAQDVPGRECIWEMETRKTEQRCSAFTCVM
eukprot:1141696-Pelagomonas_calceolata.AAC.1